VGRHYLLSIMSGTVYLSSLKFAVFVVPSGIIPNFVYSFFCCLNVSVNVLNIYLKYSV